MWINVVFFLDCNQNVFLGFATKKKDRGKDGAFLQNTVFKSSSIEFPRKDCRTNYTPITVSFRCVCCPARLLKLSHCQIPASGTVYSLGLL